MLTYMKASLFTAPPDSILVHACNTQGSWGAGIALAFRSSYPRAYEEYKSYCEAHTAEDIVGTCLLIEGIAEEGGHDIACLFTSKKYGRGKDPKEVILRSTRSAVQDLIEKNKDRKALSACRFNAGKFGVPWEETAEILDELAISMTIYDPDLIAS